jgi:hypothetical protein
MRGASVLLLVPVEQHVLVFAPLKTLVMLVRRAFTAVTNEANLLDAMMRVDNQVGVWVAVFLLKMKMKKH